MAKQRVCGSHNGYPTPSPQMSQHFRLRLNGEVQSIKFPPRPAVCAIWGIRIHVMLLSTGYQTFLGAPSSSGLHDPGRNHLPLAVWGCHKNGSNHCIQKPLSVSCSPCFNDSLPIHLHGHQTSPPLLPPALLQPSARTSELSCAHPCFCSNSTSPPHSYIP